MKRLEILLLTIIIILTLSLTIILVQSKSNLNYSTQTKAICNETNYCQDYYVFCNEREVLSTTPITGAVIQHDISWKDPRNETEKELCS